MDRIVENLLGVGRIRTGSLRPHREPTDVATLVERCAQRIGQRADSPTIEVVGDATLTAEVDPSQIDQVVTNLLENAVRHATAVVQVTVQRLADGALRIAVIDDGPGFSDAARVRLFEPFAASGERGGTGIGLTVCRSIVEAHGGTITVERSTSGGAAVSFTLPPPRLQPAGR
jgi:signal transduction histidine kinase